jgi:hypothetical protein
VVALAAVAVVPAVSELVLVVSPGYVPDDEPLCAPEPSQAHAAPAPLSASAEAIAMTAIGRLALVIRYLLVVGVVRVSVWAGKLGREARTTSATRRAPRRARGTSTWIAAVGWRPEVR